MRFVVALACEARPLIARWRLRRRVDAPYPLYEGEEAALIVSGVGKVAAAAATAYLFAATGEVRDAAWLNVGVAGHGSRAIGEGFIAHRVRDAATGRTWYPPRIGDALCELPSDELITVDAVAPTYPERGAVDMEASAVVATAARFATAELVQGYKVVSDNPQSPATEISPARVESVIAEHVDRIARVATELSALGAELRHVAEPAHWARFLAAWRFSSSEQVRLRRALQRWRALGPDDDVWAETAADGPSVGGKGAPVLRWVEAKVASLPLRLEGGS